MIGVEQLRQRLAYDPETVAQAAYMGTALQPHGCFADAFTQGYQRGELQS